MKKYILLILVSICLISLNCRAQEKECYKVKGLTDEIYYKLSGSWDLCPSCQTDPWNFSWGSGKWMANSSIIIDFGTDPPELYFGGLDDYDILSVEVVGKDQYKLNVQNRFDKEEKGYYIVHTDVKKAIWLEGGPEVSHFKPNHGKLLFYKISGPERPKKK